MTQYIYLGDKLTDKRLRGSLCLAIRRKSGKCIRGRSKMLVLFNREKVVVLARRLRKVPISWPTEKYFEELLRKETKGMTPLEFFKYLNKK